MSSIKSRIVRYDDLIPCTNAFIDARTPGSDKKENFTIIGPGVSENPNQHVHISEPHGFNIGAARQPGGCINSQHSHETAEVFVVHTGHWRFLFGPECEDGYLDAKPGDVVSAPTKMFRGFKKLDDDVGFLWVVLGHDDPGKVIWAPKVFELAKKHGLILLENGCLVDTTMGETVPDGVNIQAPTSDDLVAEFKTPDLQKLADNCVVKLEDLNANANSFLTGDGVKECPVIGAKDSDDGFDAGPIVGWWEHGFCVRSIKMAPSSKTKAHKRQEQEVIFVHQGELTINCDNEKATLKAGDTITIPVGATRQFESSEGCLSFVVRGTDNPKAAVSA